MKNIIFDFDGVIADSTDAVLKAYEKIAEIKKVKKITKDDFSKKSTKELLFYFKIKWFEIFFYIKKMKRIVKENNHLIKEIPGMNCLLNDLTLKKEINIFIISSNSRETIDKFIKNNIPMAQFTEIIGDCSLFNKQKKIKSILKKYKNATSTYIGDEIRDIRAAKYANISSIGVLWGKDSEENLKKENPTFIAKTPQDLKRIIYEF